MTERIREATAASIPSIAWLSPAARTAAETKLRMLVLKIGYPDAWPEVGSFALADDDFLSNVLAARAYEQRRTWTRARRERRRDSWESIVYPNEAAGMAAARLPIPGGYPDVFTNSIIITSGYLRPPLFDANAPPEVAYGNYGEVIAHELVHVLENHEWDGEGALHDAWTKADVEASNARRACVVEQANAYVVGGSTHLDGERTVDENVADLSGVARAYAALTKELGPRLDERGPDGWTRAQRFFIAYAQEWCQAERPGYAEKNARVDGHASHRFRVNGPLANTPGFAHAFACVPSAAMVRSADARCVVW